ncbi:MAG: hypothetical protein C4551_08725 [Bacillota bacterium]|jgi:molybdopterin converting factor small subunit|nr:MAG: hypothetical protein C4551_08725 [Bacillota bacterium]
MKVTVRVVGHAVEFFPGRKDRYDLEFEGPVTVSGILEKLGVGQALVMAAIIDGKRADFGQRVPDGAEVVLMTPPAGG